MRNVTECQQKLIALGYLTPTNEFGARNDDGRFGERSLDAYNHFRATLGKGPVVAISMAELNADLFPEEQPPPVKHRNTVFGNLVLNIALAALLPKLKGLSPMISFLTGYKTYIAGAAMLLTAVAELAGATIPGSESFTPLQWFFAGLVTITLRSAISATVMQIAALLGVDVTKLPKV